MKLTVLSPTQKRIYDKVTSVVLESESGQIEILPGHQNMVSSLKVSPVNIKMSGTAEILVINGGVISIDNDELLILTSHSIPSHEIIKLEIEKALLLAQKKITPHTLPTELIRIEKEIRYHKLKRKML